jgi:hypothetical protein
MSKQSLRARVASKLADANNNQTTVALSKRESRLVPELARKSRSGFTPELLQQRKDQLNKIDNVSVPGWNGVSLGRERRDGINATGAQYADFIQQTRRDLSALASVNTGQAIAQRLSSSGHNVSIVDRGTNDCHSGGSARPLSSKAFIHSNGQARSGSDSRITHQPDRTRLDIRTGDNWVGQSSAVSLGHELIHAVHNAEGTNTTKTAHQRGSLDPEERQTVGSPIAPHSTAAPQLTENQLRKELELPQRTHYGRHRV